MVEIELTKGQAILKNYLKKSKLSNKFINNLIDLVEKRFKKTFKDYGWSNACLPFLGEKFTNKKLMNSKELMKMLGKTYKNKCKFRHRFFCF